FFFFSSRRRHTRSKRDWSSDVCSSDLEPHPKFLSATIISPFFTWFTNSLSISSIQCFANSAGSEEFKYLAGIITSVSTLSPNLNTVPFACIVISSSHYSNSHGQEILPVTALAAATAGLAK